VVWKGDGRAGAVGLRDALVRAHDIRELVDGSPLVTVSLHRLLLAILHRNFGPATFDAWKVLWRAGRWDAATLDAYFAQWRHRFDLFDPERPFYQSTSLEDGTKVHPPALLAQELATGNNATVFDHSVSGSPTPIPPGQAARLLIARQLFSVGGGVSEPFYLSHAPLTTGYTVLALGETLFETLALNLTEYAAVPGDAPVWEQDVLAVPDEKGTHPRGRLDYFTWLSRRIKLLTAEVPLRVTGCQLAQNLKLDAETLDPAKSYRMDKDRGWLPRRLDPDRALWRDSHAVFQQTGESGRRAEVFNWLARIDEARRDGEIEADTAYPLSVLGMGQEATAKAADISIWRHERFTVPLAYLHEPELLGVLERALALAEGVGRLLRAGRMDIVVNEKKVSVPRPFQLLAEAMLPTIGGKADRKAVDGLVDHLAPERRYWSRLEVPFRRLLAALPEDQDKETGAYGITKLPEWAVTLRDTAWAAFNEATSGLDQSARALEGVAKAERELTRRLYDSHHLGEYLRLREEATA
jgi:CRISPR system Cascade subunit CasA